MLKRLGWVLGVGWIVVALWAGHNRGDGSGIQGEDYMLALAPVAVVWGGLVGLRFIVRGSPRRSATRLYRR